MSLRIRATDIASIQDRTLFFDANVLLYLFGGVSQPSWAVNGFSRIFKQCKTQGNKLCIDVIILSEFINRFMRIEYENYLKINTLDRGGVNFKKFRSTNKGIEVAEDVELVVKDTILRHFTMIGKVFNEPDICAIDLANADFNDELIIQTCQEHQCVLVTNDTDFKEANIDILTANNKLS